LEINGTELDPTLDDEDESTGHTRLEEVVLKVVTGEMKKDELTTFLLKHLREA
jgi:hypothetical protein